ncbi:hypothetical protein [Bacillus atrophaeus]|uniref:hypothetical protein n=1 Tax=Bacillus atrophaeus TaxID=1452 RepID=UPI000B455DAB|nr:hypothetical protein [Bacillus atrophaeus]ARW05758.1 hypothetical protein S101359_00730 [Bacillus atrophaeus]
MYNQLREIVNLLEKINSHGQTNVLSVEFEEQKDNLNDLSLLLTDMDKLLKKSKHIDPNNVQDVDRPLIEVHRRMTSLEWLSNFKKATPTKRLVAFYNFKNRHTLHMCEGESTYRSGISSYKSNIKLNNKT